jgi:predicted PurR-regulated permease PerM
MIMERNALFWLLAAVIVAILTNLLAPVLLPFVAGLTLAYFVNPLVDALSALRIPRWLSAVVILLTTIFAIVLLLIFLVPVLVQQAVAFAESLPRELDRLRALGEEAARNHFGERYPAVQDAVSRTLADVSNTLPSYAGRVADALLSGGSAAFSTLSLLLVTPLVFFYALLDWPRLIATVDSWLPRAQAPQIRLLAAEIDSRVSAFIRGQGIVCLVLATFYGIALSSIGLNNGLLVGVLTGLFSFIPFAGWALGLITGTALAIVQFWPDMMAVALVPAVFLAGQVLDASLLNPQIVGSKVGLHPVWLIFALLSFSYLFGFLGLLVAVPVAAAIGVLVRFGMETYRGSSIYHGGGPGAGTA